MGYPLSTTSLVENSSNTFSFWRNEQQSDQVAIALKCAYCGTFSRGEDKCRSCGAPAQAVEPRTWYGQGIR